MTKTPSFERSDQDQSKYYHTFMNIIIAWAQQSYKFEIRKDRLFVVLRLFYSLFPSANVTRQRGHIHIFGRPSPLVGAPEDAPAWTQAPCHSDRQSGAAQCHRAAPGDTGLPHRVHGPAVASRSSSSSVP